MAPHVWGVVPGGIAQHAVSRDVRCRNPAAGYRSDTCSLPPHRFYQDGSYAPAEREAFDEQLAAFYSSHSAVQVSCMTEVVWHLWRALAMAVLRRPVQALHAGEAGTSSQLPHTC